MNIPKVVAIVQARMGSTRLPGKVMLRLGHRSMLGYLVDRLSYARTLSSIVIATTTHMRDDSIVEEARRLGVDCFRGSEHATLHPARQPDSLQLTDVGAWRHNLKARDGNRLSYGCTTLSFGNFGDGPNHRSPRLPSFPVVAALVRTGG